ncbi:hypothetical protein H2203_000102 [Taxawa tesnikishii (nom. ined.)]|nr:hypothetical protein H2203_000102 [Dothideales sp. JES 119]
MPLTIHPPRRPSITTAPEPAYGAPTHDSAVAPRSNVRSASPVPPPTSPLTPVPRPAVPVLNHNHVVAPPPADVPSVPQSSPSCSPALPPTQFIEQLPSRPFSDADNTDAIALRAAISSLQIQRKRAQDDMRTLQRVKEDAVAHPEEFKQELLARARAAKSKAHPATPLQRTTPPSDTSSPSEKDAGAGAADARSSRPEHHLDDEHSTPPQQISTSDNFRFRTPQMQNVVRCPPINWAKYHIVGEPLERMHRVQQERPSDGLGGEGRATIAAPYSPFTDVLEKDVGVGYRRGEGRKDSAAGKDIRERGATWWEFRSLPI